MLGLATRYPKGKGNRVAAVRRRGCCEGHDGVRNRSNVKQPRRYTRMNYALETWPRTASDWANQMMTGTCNRSYSITLSAARFLCSESVGLSSHICRSTLCVEFSRRHSGFERGLWIKVRVDSLYDEILEMPTFLLEWFKMSTSIAIFSEYSHVGLWQPKAPVSKSRIFGWNTDC